MHWTPSSLARMPHRPLPASAVHASCRPPDPPRLITSYRTRPPPLSLSCASCPSPVSPISPLYSGAKKPSSTVTFLPPSSALGSSRRRPHTTFATCPCRRDPRSPLSTAPDSLSCGVLKDTHMPQWEIMMAMPPRDICLLQ
jgi:hypothetical protein